MARWGYRASKGKAVESKTFQFYQVEPGTPDEMIRSTLLTNYALAKDWALKSQAKNLNV
jgi:hypothetical protein